MVSVDLWLWVKVTSEGYEWRLRAKRVMVTSEASNGRVQWHSYGGRFWSVLPHTAHFVIPVISLLWRKVLECSSSHCSLRYPCDLTPMEEGSGVFFLTLLTSSSLWSHSYGGRFWSVLPHCSLRHPCVLTHFVIPVFSHPWLVFSPISSLSLTSLSSHLTQVIPDYSLSHHSCYHSSHTQCSHTHPHSLHSPSHLIVIPGYSLPSLVLPCSLIPAFSLTSLLWVLTPITCLLTLTISHRVSPYALSHPSHLCHHTEWSHITCVLRELVLPLTLPWCRTTTKSTHSLSSLSHTLPSMSSLWTLPWCRTTTKSTHSLLWENLCSHSHSHGVVLPPSHHSLLWENLCSHSHSHGVVLPPSLPTHPHQSLCSHSHSHGVVLPPSHHSHPHQSLCSHSHSHLPCPHTLCSPHFISPHKCITNHLPHSPTHHASITSSSPHHLFLSPITTNRFLSLHTTLLTPPFHSQPSQSSPKSSPISIHTHNENSRTP